MKRIILLLAISGERLATKFAISRRSPLDLGPVEIIEILARLLNLCGEENSTPFFARYRGEPFAPFTSAYSATGICGITCKVTLPVHQFLDKSALAIHSKSLTIFSSVLGLIRASGWPITNLDSAALS